jgi:DNA-binding CsgD family transcriptional regulator
MLSLIVYVIFVFSVAFASTGVVLSTRLRNRYKSELFSTLLYYQVFIFTFGFYGIWGRIVLTTFLSDYVSDVLLTRFTDISVLLGLPFLVFAWLMLIRFSREITGQKNSNWFVFWFLLINFLAIFGLGYFIASGTDMKPSVLVKDYFIVLNFFYTTIAALIILFTGRNKLVILKYENRILVYSLVLIMMAQCLVLAFYKTDPVIGLIFVFLFFAGNAFLPVYLTYFMHLSIFMGQPMKDVSFDDFCKKFEISPRESDIIREICNGLSNKEISDKLFISLQTVKDHTHRIYIKINVKSRVQLINLFNKTHSI